MPVPFSQVEALLALPRDFYERPTIEVARDLLGKTLIHRRRAGRIVEVEAYLGEQDRAAHAWSGRTRRTEVLYGPGGYCYVYLVYGMYHCLNVVAETAGSPGCVLVRALEPLCGIETKPPCNGPGRLTRALGIDLRQYGADLTAGPLTVRDALRPLTEIVQTGTRIGIRHATDWPLRFWLASPT